MAKYEGGGHFAFNHLPLAVLIGKIANHSLSLTPVTAIRLPQPHIQARAAMNSSARLPWSPPGHLGLRQGTMESDAGASMDSSRLRAMETTAGAAMKTVSVSKIIPTLGFKCSLKLTTILGDDFGRGVLG